jgi:hypothetical protein
LLLLLPLLLPVDVALVESEDVITKAIANTAEGPLNMGSSGVTSLVEEDHSCSTIGAEAKIAETDDSDALEDEEKAIEGYSNAKVEALPGDGMKKADGSEGEEADDETGATELDDFMDGLSGGVSNLLLSGAVVRAVEPRRQEM